MIRVVLLAGTLLLALRAAYAVVGGGDGLFSPAGASRVKFSHEYHVMQKKLRCSECHNAIFAPVVRKGSITMDEIYKGRTCGVCHNGQRAYNARGNCVKCHAG